MKEQKNKEQEQFAKMLGTLRYWLIGRRYYMAHDAMEFAHKHTIGLRRDGVTPEFHHQVMVCLYLTTLDEMLQYPEETYCTALLHDVREDYDVDLLMLKTFTTAQSKKDRKRVDRVVRAVEVLSKQFKGIKKSPESYFDGIGYDVIASAVKGADRIHNFDSMMGVFSPTKVTAYLDEGEEHILSMLKVARRRFVRQASVYQNIRCLLKSQINMGRHASKSDTPT